MFTGLIESIGQLSSAHKVGSEMDLEIDLGLPGFQAEVGDSIALSGVCCTVTGVGAGGHLFRLSEETLRRTWFAAAVPGRTLNVERALRAGDPMGGHMVQGHVDELGRVLEPIDARDGGEFWLEIPDSLHPYCVAKGSITVDGISLTLASIDGPRAMIAVIPHTAAVTTLGTASAGQAVNLEVDIIAKYVERMLAARFDS
jgi:riboflavin synthase